MKSVRLKRTMQRQRPLSGFLKKIAPDAESHHVETVEACADPAVPEPIPCGTKCPRSEGACIKGCPLGYECRLCRKRGEPYMEKAHKQELLKPDYLHIDDDTRLGSKVDLRTRAGCHRSMYTIGKRFVSFYGLRY